MSLILQRVDDNELIRRINAAEGVRLHEALFLHGGAECAIIVNI